jgi:hypothetical protein
MISVTRGISSFFLVECAGAQQPETVLPAICWVGGVQCLVRLAGA